MTHQHDLSVTVRGEGGFGSTDVQTNPTNDAKLVPGITESSEPQPTLPEALTSLAPNLNAAGEGSQMPCDASDASLLHILGID